CPLVGPVRSHTGGMGPLAARFLTRPNRATTFAVPRPVPVGEVFGTVSGSRAVPLPRAKEGPRRPPGGAGGRARQAAPESAAAPFGAGFCVRPGCLLRPGGLARKDAKQATGPVCTKD